MKKHPAPRRCIELGFIAALALILSEADIGGVVHLKFNVNEFGTKQNETVLKSAHPKLDKAALEDLQRIPRLEPGTQQGRPVRVTYTIPVRFTIR